MTKDSSFKKRSICCFLIGCLTLFASSALTASESFIYGDALPNAPELAYRGQYSVGVRTLDFINPQQLDFSQITETDSSPLADRSLKIEIWYPAIVPEGKEQRTEYQDHLLSKKQFTIEGRALRNAKAATGASSHPLIIISHGHPGSRILLAYLAENIASKGYIVAAIDHTDSTHAEQYQNNFGSTLYHRSKDQLFTLNKIDELSQVKSNFLYNIVDVNRSAIIGYSMGGYGALNSAGAGYSTGFVALANVSKLIPNNQLQVMQAGNKQYQASQDKRIRAIVSIAPWGGAASLKAFGVPKGLAAWDSNGLSGMTVPSMFIVGTDDQTVFYEGGVKSLYDDAINSDRYLLVFDNAQHHLATHPPPPEAIQPLDFHHYEEAVWSLKRLNNINQHFITAFLDSTLKDGKNSKYLRLIENSNEGQWSQNKDGSFNDEHTAWIGFPKASAAGMHLYHQLRE